MAEKVTITSNNGLGWSFGDEGLRDVTLSTDHGLGWNVSEQIIPGDAVVTNNGEEVTNNGETVTNGA